MMEHIPFPEGKKKKSRETRPGTLAKTRTNQQIMMDQNPFPDKRKERKGETNSGTLAGTRRKEIMTEQNPLKGKNYTSIDPKQQQTMFPRCSCAIKKSLVAVFLRKETKEQGETRPGTEPGTRMNQKIMMERNPLPEKGKKSRETSQGTLAGKRRKGKS